MTTEMMHHPTPEFRDFLEGEIAREFRSQRSFARLRIAAVLLATLAAGTTAGLASAQIRQGAQRDSLLLQSIHKDGTWDGYDIPLIKMVSDAVSIPVVACGGASNIDDFRKAITEGGASAVAAGSMFVYQKKGMGVLISFPSGGLKI